MCEGELFVNAIKLVEFNSSWNPCNLMKKKTE